MAIANSTSRTQHYVDNLNDLLRKIHQQYNKNSAVVGPATTAVVINNAAEEIKTVTAWQCSSGVEEGFDEAVKNLQQWLDSDDARWFFENSVSVPVGHCNYNYPNWAIDCVIRVRLAGPALTEYLLFRTNI